MEISEIRSAIDLINFYNETDTNRNGRIEASESSNIEIARYDRSEDRSLSPWEVMEAVNRSNPVRVFLSAEIRSMQESNSQGITFQNITLESESTIQGISLPAGTEVAFNKNGRIDHCILSTAITIEGISLRAGTEVGFYEDGSISYDKNPKPAPTSIANLALAGREQLFEAGPSPFLMTGSLEDFCERVRHSHTGEGVEFCMGGGSPVDMQRFLATAGGTPIAGSSEQRTPRITINLRERRYDHGQISEGILDEDTLIGGIKFKAGSRVTFNLENGRVSEGILAENTSFTIQHQSVEVKAGTTVRFYNDGRLSEILLIENTPLTLQGREVKFKAGTSLKLTTIFDEDGEVMRGLESLEGELAENTTVGITAKNTSTSGISPALITLQEIELKQGTRVYFSGDGRFFGGTLAVPTTIQRAGFENLELLAGTEVHFRDNGQVLYIVLNEDDNIQGIDFKAGTQVHFDGGSSNFISSEFWSDLGLESLFKLCKSINEDGYGISFRDPENPAISLLNPDYINALLDYENNSIEAFAGKLIDKLNTLLTMPNFYDRWLMKGKSIVMTENIKSLIETTENYRWRSFSGLSYLEQEKILRLNRLLIEATYPQISPKNQNGRVQHALIFEDTTFQSVGFLAGSDVYFRNGNLSKARISEDTPIQGTEFKEETWVWFNESDGLVLSGILASDTPFRIMDREIELKEGEMISFYKESRQVAFGTLAENTTFWIEGQEVELEDTTPVFFYENNPQILRGAILHGNLPLQMQGERVEFLGGYIDWLRPNDNGRLVGELFEWVKWNEWEWRGWRWSGEQMLWIHENGRIAEGILGSDSPFYVRGQRIMFKIGKTVRFHPNGQISDGTLAADTTMQVNGQNTLFKAETILSFYDNGQLSSAQLTADTNIYSGGQWIKFKQGKVWFHDPLLFELAGKTPAEQIREGTLAEDAFINSGDRKIKFMAGTKVWLGRSGEILSAELGQDTSFPFQNLELKAGTIVNFGNGQIFSATLSADTPINLPDSEEQLIFKAGTTVQFLNGRILEGTLADSSLSILGEIIELRSGTKIRFYSNGKIRYLELAEIVKIKEISFKAGTMVGFHENGNLEHGTLAENTPFKIFNPDGSTQYITLKEGTNVWLHENGNLWYGTLAVAASLGGSTREAGTMVWFNEAGLFSSAQAASEDDNPY
jgi:plastocyanin